jgi:uncharacterized protein YfiM (DUF2279 family)
LVKFRLNGNLLMKFLALGSFFVSKHNKWALFLIFLSLFPHASGAQSNLTQEPRISLLTPADSLNHRRLWVAGVGGTGIYSASSFSLYHVWYKKYPLIDFHFFNDWEEWELMDKAGHVYTSWMQSYMMYSVADWVGYSDRQSILIGALSSTIFQSTLEIMDGCSENWGFSLSDMGANLLGTGLFTAQEYYWGEQRFLLKYSVFPITYSSGLLPAVGQEGQISHLERANQLFGSSLPTRLLKDYNSQSIWLSFNPEVLVGEFGWPDWLNLALGYSPANIYGTNNNTWIQDGVLYDLNSVYPRYHQFFLAPDINWSKIKTSSPFLKSLFRLLNVIKVPAPALELNDLEGVQLVFHWFYF